MQNHMESQLGNYRLIRLLGKGAFAEVYLGEHIFLKSLAAIKILHTQLEKAEVDQFIREAQLIARLKDPHIILIHDFSWETIRNFFYLVMDYAPNGNLRERHSRGSKLPLTIVVSYVKQIAIALQKVHNEKIIHRDIKPENLLLGQNYEIILSDFGIATIAQTRSSRQSSGIAGTAIYMAPEQFRGIPQPASDQYALGIMAYEWLYGEPPFTNGDFIQLGYQHVYEQPPSLHDKIPLLPQEVEQVIMKALAKNPQQRFSNIQAFADTLEQAQAHTTTQHSFAQPSNTLIQPISPSFSSPQSVAPTLQKIPPISTLFTNGAPSLPTPFATFAPEKIVNTKAPSAPPKPSNTTRPEQPSAKPKHSITRRVVLGSLIASVGVAGVAWLAPSLPHYVSFLSSSIRSSSSVQSTFTTLKATWSPDSKSLAVGNAKYNRVEIWDVSTGKTIKHYDYSSGAVNDIAGVIWSPSSQYIAVMPLSSGTVQMWDTRTGKIVDAYSNQAGTTPCGDCGSSIAWSPDTKYVAYSDDTSLTVWDMAAKKVIFHDDTASLNAGTPLAWAHSKYLAYRGEIPNVGDGILVWDVATHSTVFSYQTSGSTVSQEPLSMEWSPDGTQLAWVSSEGTAYIFAVSAGKMIATRPKTGGCIAWSPNSSHLISPGSNGTVEVWSVTTGKTLLSFTVPGSNYQTGLAWAPNGKYIAAFDGSSHHVWICDAITGKILSMYD